VKRLILGIAVAAALGGCSAGGSGTGASYKAGYTFAEVTFVQQGQALVTTPAAECALLASQGDVPAVDDPTQWESGCEAALSSYQSPGVTVPKSN
jgi:hypothetical protein